jgi:hypothetical protein
LRELERLFRTGFQRGGYVEWAQENAPCDGD